MILQRILMLPPQNFDKYSQLAHFVGTVALKLKYPSFLKKRNKERNTK